MATTLAEVERLVDQLSESDRAAIRQRLSTPLPKVVSEAEAEAAVAAFHDVSKRPAATSGPSMTEQLFRDRR